MAISTQIRLQQLSGSFGSGATQITDGLAAGAAVSADASLAGSLSEIASAVKRINGGTKFQDLAAGLFTHSEMVLSGSRMVVMNGTNDGDAELRLIADRADDAGDSWQIQNKAGDQNFAIQNDKATKDAFVSVLTLVPNATPANTVCELAGLIKLGGNKIQDSAGGDALFVSTADASNPVVDLAAGTGKVRIIGTSGIEGPSAAGLKVASVSGQALEINGGVDGAGGSDIEIQAGDELFLKDQWSKDAAGAAGSGVQLTSELVKLASSQAEWNSFGSNFGASSTIIGALNTAATGAPTQVNKYVEKMSGGAADFGIPFARSSIKITNAAASALTGAVAVVLKNQAGAGVTFTAGSDWTITADDAGATATSLRGAINGDANFSADVLSDGVTIEIRQAATGAVPSSSMSKSGGTSTGMSLGGDFEGSSGSQTVVTGTAINLVDVDAAEMNKLVDVYLNGQLLVSGAGVDSNSIPQSVTEDYYFVKDGADAQIAFGFTLETTDVVSVVVR